MKQKLPLGGHELTVVAAKAIVDRQTVMRYLRGSNVREVSKQMIEGALDDLGKGDLKRIRVA